MHRVLPRTAVHVLHGLHVGLWPNLDLEPPSAGPVRRVTFSQSNLPRLSLADRLDLDHCKLWPLASRSQTLSYLVLGIDNIAVSSCEGFFFSANVNHSIPARPALSAHTRCTLHWATTVHCVLHKRTVECAVLSVSATRLPCVPCLIALPSSFTFSH